MKFHHILKSSAFQISSLIFVLGFLLGVLNIHFSDKNDYCVMTYMFEYPQFVRISFPENKVYPQYGLYAYSEGRFTERARKMWFEGVPVLFLPGNSGSHMQARSLASVALRKALGKGYEYHFDFFTISYNEELSGLYGGVLQHQTDFAAACILKILSLYKNNKYTKSVPTTVILIGHSMGGLIAKRLLVYPDTLYTTRIAITLAAPLEAPVINFDVHMNDYYMYMNAEWDIYRNTEIEQNKILISFGSGPRDILMPSGLTGSNESYISALTTAIPGVWLSPDHVSIVWCKQLVMAISRYLFDIVDHRTKQIHDNQQILKSKAVQYFQANHSMILSPKITRANVTMLTNAFWYEDNRRIYQISQPQFEKTSYLMIRLVNYPQNRFAAVEAVNVEDKDWIFGCNAMFSMNNYRYCKHATSLTELSRWTGAANDFGRRKLATIHLHSIMEQNPDWSHVIVKVSPTNKPRIKSHLVYLIKMIALMCSGMKIRLPVGEMGISLATLCKPATIFSIIMTYHQVEINVDINDLASRQITVDLPFIFSFDKTVIVQETEKGSLYYELILPGFDKIYQAYLLYVEPIGSCKVNQYHVSAEVHVPWAQNHEYFHYYTHIKHTPMKLRLYKSNPNVTLGLSPSEYVKVTLLLDPQCTFTVSITSSWYYQLGQYVRNFSTTLIPYVAAIVLLAVRSNILSLRDQGTCMSIHMALMSKNVKPHYVLLSGRLFCMAILLTPALSFLFENAGWRNLEMQYFIRSLLVIPTYMIALGLLNIAAAAVVAVMVFSSQLAHRLLFRIMWRGGSGLAEKVAVGLQKVPMLVSAALICAVPLSCGAASLAAGAAFYAFMISKMYEEYLEDYVYKLMAKGAARICRIFVAKNGNLSNENVNETELVPTETSNMGEITENVRAIENKAVENKDYENKEVNTTDENGKRKENDVNQSNALVKKEDDALVKQEESTQRIEEKCDNSRKKTVKTDEDIDEELNNLNFHMTMFFMWMTVTLVNVPALLTWARNFKYSMVLKPDASYHTGLVMTACSCIWQINGPRKKLRYYDAVATFLFTMAVSIIVLGPFSPTVVNYGVTCMFAVITLQQLLDSEVTETVSVNSDQNKPETSDDSETIPKNDDVSNDQENSTSSNKTENTSKNDENSKTADNIEEKNSEPSTSNVGNTLDDDCMCNENRIYGIFINLREKFSFNDD